MLTSLNYGRALSRPWLLPLTASNDTRRTRLVSGALAIWIWSACATDASQPPDAAHEAAAKNSEGDGCASASDAGKQAKAVRDVTSLAAALSDWKPETSHAAEEALASLGEAAVAPSVKRLADGDVRCCNAVANVLAKIGRPSVPSVVKLLKHNDPRIRLCALEILGRIGPGTKDAIPAILDLKDRTLPERAEIVDRTGENRASHGGCSQADCQRSRFGKRGPR